MSQSNVSRVKKIVLAGIFLALLIVLSRFLSIKTPILKISFAYVPVYLAGIILGPTFSTIIEGLGDLVGATLFPMGPFFIGYTISAVINGFIYGALLHKRFKADISDKNFIIRLVIASFLQLILIDGILNTIWISITGGKSFWVLVPVRMTKELIMIPIQVISIFLLEKALRPAINRFLKDKEND